MYCIFCRRETRFVKFGSSARPHAQCGRCGSLERHRLVWTWLERFEREHLRTARLLHIAPEPCLRRVLKPLVREYVAPRWDLRRTPAASRSFDVILHNHVMEHIFEDVQAFREQCRILRPGGVLFFTVPMRRAHTVESLDASEDRQTRKRRFGQANHWRIYGAEDIVARIAGCGFVEVRRLDAAAHFPAEEVQRGNFGSRSLVRASV